MQHAAGRPDGRYGEPRTGPRPGVVAALVALGALFVGWVVWAALGATSPDAGGEVTAFRVRSDDRIDVRVTATTGSRGGFSCRVQALDRTRGVVGVAGVTLQADDPGRRDRWVTVRTRDRAVTATVAGCSASAPGQD